MKLVFMSIKMKENMKIKYLKSWLSQKVEICLSLGQKICINLKKFRISI